MTQQHTPEQEIALINRLIAEAKRDLQFQKYEARETIKRLERQRAEANARAVAAIAKAEGRS